MNTRGCFTMMGLGFGVVLAGGLIYLLANDELARWLFVGFGMFLLGASIVGFWVSYTGRSVAQAFSNQRHNEKTTYNLPPANEYPSLGPGSPPSWWIEPQRSEYPALPPAPPGWPTSANDKGQGPDDNDFMA
jgi:hypothetical protein